MGIRAGYEAVAHKFASLGVHLLKHSVRLHMLAIRCGLCDTAKERPRSTGSAQATDTGTSSLSSSADTTGI
ncbi:hypothetical protein M8818_005740 [Zalaria obscura]|uniref:Uncharacterized protein n=1 Tax=Zalaria obscura TaxID=2024903 RepID=A0ACC3S9R1_9PEZI